MMRSLLFNLAALSLCIPLPGIELSLSALQGNWLETNLPDLPLRLANGSLEVYDARFVGIGMGVTVVSELHHLIPFKYAAITKLEAETQMIRHYAAQNHWETTVALILRSQRWSPRDILGIDIAVGDGVSYAWEPPAFERGPHGRRGEDTRQWQNFIAIETSVAPYFLSQNTCVFVRIHHRSGVWGLISPQATGSNFAAFGLRFTW
ncbi:MAG: hypothetical protein NZ552_00575 [Planctomycetes bacterium]|nr:hypothetical protein [Planctomycetota bacterium]